MGPIIASVLTGAGIAIARWLAKKASDAKKAKEPEKRPESTVRYTPQGMPPPLETPAIQPKVFLFKWLAKFMEYLSQRRPTAEKTHRPIARQKPSLSLRMTKIINLLNKPLFYVGPILLVWLVVNIVLQYILPRESYGAIAGYSHVIVAVLAPAAVGYWTNWLAIKMLFHPQRKNAVWHGLVPARRKELVEKMAEGIRNRLISPEIIRDYLHDSGILREITDKLGSSTKEIVDNPEFRKEIKDLVYERIYKFCTNPETRQWATELVDRKLQEWLGSPFSGILVRFIKLQCALPFARKTILDKIPELLREIPSAMDHAFAQIDKNLDMLPDLLKQHGKSIEAGIAKAIIEGINSLDINEIVKSQLDRMDEVEFEELLTSGVSSEIVFIQTCGGFFGALVGLSIIYPPLLLVLLGSSVILYVLYHKTVQKSGITDR